ncbi:MAG: hypothetical protein AAGG07_02495 [Planctomycetota bacterium]
MPDAALAWSDKYRTPDTEALVAPLSETGSALFGTARDHLRETLECTETLDWHGIPWRWSFRLDHGTGKNAETLAFLVPDPEKPLLVTPLPVTFLGGLRPRELSKAGRDLILNAPEIDGTYWVEWELTTKTGLAETLGLLDKRVAAITGEPTAQPARR